MSSMIDSFYYRHIYNFNNIYTTHIPCLESVLSLFNRPKSLMLLIESNVLI